MKVGTNQRTMIRFNKAKDKNKEKAWYSSVVCELIKVWYKSGSFESNQVDMNQQGQDQIIRMIQFKLIFESYRGLRNKWFCHKK